jgi:hypothetical protein
MSKTYSEAAQAVYFKAARDLRKVAGEVLLDSCGPGATITPTGAQWAVGAARKYALAAHDLENKGHEVAVCTNRQETDNGKSKDAYSAAIDTFEAFCRQHFDADWDAIRNQAYGW